MLCLVCLPADRGTSAFAHCCVHIHRHTHARKIHTGALTQGHEGAANKTLDLREFNVRPVYDNVTLLDNG